MEAEELEELNPSIKGRRLQVVDEVFAAYAFLFTFCPSLSKIVSYY